MSIVFKYEPGFYENFSTFKKNKVKENTKSVKTAQKEIKVVNFEEIKQENSELIDVFSKKMDSITDFLNLVELKNNQLLSHENFKNMKLSTERNKNLIKYCGALQQATINFVENLKPENVENYLTIKNEYIACKNQLAHI